MNIDSTIAARLAQLAALGVPAELLEWQAIRASGPGGQHVNKVSSAVQLRVDSRAADLSAYCRQRLHELGDQRVTADGMIVIKAQQYRSQPRNRQDALERLLELLQRASQRQKPRRRTKPTRGSQQRRMDSKSKRGKQKALRGKVAF